MIYPDCVWVLVSLEVAPLTAQSWGCAPLDAGGVAKALACANDDAVRKAVSSLSSGRFASTPQDPVALPENSICAGRKGPVPAAEASEAPASPPQALSKSTRSAVHGGRLSQHPAWRSAGASQFDKEPVAAKPRSRVPLSRHPAWTSATGGRRASEPACGSSGQDEDRRAAASKRLWLHPAWKSASSYTLERPSAARRDSDASFHPAWKSANSFTLERPSAVQKSSDSASSIASTTSQENLGSDDASSVKVSITCPRTPSRTKTMQSLDRVLIVDADTINLKVVKRILQRRGAKVTCVEDGLEFIEQCITWNKRFDVILVDDRMRYMGVDSVISALRKYEQENGLPKTPVVVTTANLDSRTVLNYALSGIDGVLAKPVNMRHLPDMLDAYALHLQMKDSLSPIAEDGTMGACGMKKRRSPLFVNSTMFGDLEIFGELEES